MIVKLKETLPKNSVLDFFGKGDYILASTEMNWYSQDSLLIKLQNRIRKEVVFLSAILDRDLSVDITNNYLLLNNKMKFMGAAWSTRKFLHELSEEALEQLSDNAYQVLRKLKGKSVEWFLTCESIFVNAHKSKTVPDYWLYLETLLSFNRKEKKVKGLVSTIVLLNEQIIRDQRILTSLRNSFGPFTRGFHAMDVISDKFRNMQIEFKKGKIPK